MANLGCASTQLTEPLLNSPSVNLPPQGVVFWAESFDEPHLTQWHEFSITGHTQYQVVDLGTRRCLKAQSHASDSILLRRVRFSPNEYPWFSWEWRVDQPVDGENLKTKEGADAAARVYVYFNTSGLLWQKRSIDYVWSLSLPVETVLTSPYSPLSKIIVADSSPAALKQWHAVERNLKEDYIRCFGSPPPDVVAIGIMSDTDNTMGESLAYFDDLRVSQRPSAAAEPSANSR